MRLRSKLREFAVLYIALQLLPFFVTVIALALVAGDHEFISSFDMKGASLIAGLSWIGVSGYITIFPWSEIEGKRRKLIAYLIGFSLVIGSLMFAAFDLVLTNAGLIEQLISKIPIWSFLSKNAQSGFAILIN